ncbi:MAG: transporter permease [Pseudonocardiales bacterium]|nr:transporter permease [Pseudonocardiales bacterium]
MTSTTIAPELGITPIRVIRSEWIKFRSLRSTWFSFGATLLVAIGLGILFSALRGHDIATHGGVPPDFDATQMSLRGMFLAQLAVGVLGVLLITGEYGTGMIRASLSAVPRRVPVWWAKSIVFGGATFVIATTASLIAFLGGQAAMHSDHLGVSLSSPGAARAVVGGGLYLVVVGLLALGCGFALRSTGGAIATLFGLLLVLPILGEALPSSWQVHIVRYLPMNAGSAVMNTRPDPSLLGPWAGLGVFALYAAAALAVGLVVLRRRDA